jgi:hypothetical protein
VGALAQALGLELLQALGLLQAQALGRELLQAQALGLEAQALGRGSGEPQTPCSKPARSQ